MTIHRRHFVAAIGATAAACALPRRAAAEASPTLRILVGYAAGGAADTVARKVAMGLATQGESAIIENKPGAAGRLSVDALVAAPADGTTLLFTPLGALTIYPHIYRGLRYDPLHDLLGVASVCEMTFALAVGASSPARTLQQYLDLAKEKPTLAAFGTPGAGTAMHFLGVMLSRAAKVPLTHVPYKGGSAAVTDAIGGSLPAVITTLPNLLPMHRAGKLRILAISNAEPLAALPGVPTFRQAGFDDLDVVETFAFFARSGTPPARIAALNGAINASVDSAAVKGTLEQLQFLPRTMTPAALDARVRTEYARWSKVVQETGYKAEN